MLINQYRSHVLQFLHNSGSPRWEHAPYVRAVLQQQIPQRSAQLPKLCFSRQYQKKPTAQSPIPKTAQKVKLKIEGSKDSEKKIPIPTAMKTGIQ